MAPGLNPAEPGARRFLGAQTRDYSLKPEYVKAIRKAQEALKVADGGSDPAGRWAAAGAGVGEPLGHRVATGTTTRVSRVDVMSHR
jgi:hypothetical protein